MKGWEIRKELETVERITFQEACERRKEKREGSSLRGMQSPERVTEFSASEQLGLVYMSMERGKMY